MKGSEAARRAWCLGRTRVWRSAQVAGLVCLATWTTAPRTIAQYAKGGPKGTLSPLPPGGEPDSGKPKGNQRRHQGKTKQKPWEPWVPAHGLIGFKLGMTRAQVIKAGKRLGLRGRLNGCVEPDCTHGGLRGPIKMLGMKAASVNFSFCQKRLCGIWLMGRTLSWDIIARALRKKYGTPPLGGQESRRGQNPDPPYNSYLSWLWKQPDNLLECQLLKYDLHAKPALNVPEYVSMACFTNAQTDEQSRNYEKRVEKVSEGL